MEVLSLGFLGERNFPIYRQTYHSDGFFCCVENSGFYLTRQESINLLLSTFVSCTA